MVQLEDFNKNVESFNKTVKTLGDKVNKCGVDWKDEKYSHLSSRVKEIANASKQVMIAVTEYRTAINRFNSIESE